MSISFEDVERAATSLQFRAGNLVEQAHRRRVSHTVSGVIRTTLSLAELHNQAQSDASFVRMLIHALHNSQEKGGFGVETQHNSTDNTLFVSGSFQIPQLRRFILTVPQPLIINDKPLAKTEAF